VDSNPDPRIRKIGVVGIITLSDWVHTRYCPYVALTYPSQLGVRSPAGTWLGLVTPPSRPLPPPPTADHIHIPHPGKPDLVLESMTDRSRQGLGLRARSWPKVIWRIFLIA
jgi:hypothetical protein